MFDVDQNVSKLGEDTDNQSGMVNGTQRIWFPYDHSLRSWLFSLNGSARTISICYSSQLSAGGVRQVLRSFSNAPKGQFYRDAGASYLCPKELHSARLLCLTKEHYFSGLSIDLRVLVPTGPASKK